MDGWMDGWMDTWMGGWMDGWRGWINLSMPLSYKCPIDAVLLTLDAWPLNYSLTNRIIFLFVCLLSEFQSPTTSPNLETGNYQLWKSFESGMGSTL